MPLQSRSPQVLLLLLLPQMQALLCFRLCRCCCSSCHCCDCTRQSLLQGLGLVG
jgi:hypothetical protein